MRSYLVAASAGLIACCAPVQAVEPPAQFEIHRLDEDMDGSWRFNSHLNEPARLDIRSESEWRDFWRELIARQGHSPVPAVDFDREMILVAAMGARPTGGYRIEILSVADDGREIVVRVAETSPGRRCGTIQAVTEPADIVRVPRSNKPIRWLEERRVTDCR